LLDVLKITHPRNEMLTCFGTFLLVSTDSSAFDSMGGTPSEPYGKGVSLYSMQFEYLFLHLWTIITLLTEVDPPKYNRGMLGA
jgi:hypothetical protein